MRVIEAPERATPWVDARGGELVLYVPTTTDKIEISRELLEMCVLHSEKMSVYEITLRRIAKRHFGGRKLARQALRRYQ